MQKKKQDRKNPAFLSGLTVINYYEVASVELNNVGGYLNVSFPGDYKLREFIILIEFSGVTSAPNTAYSGINGTGGGMYSVYNVFSFRDSSGYIAIFGTATPRGCQNICEYIQGNLYTSTGRTSFRMRGDYNTTEYFAGLTFYASVAASKINLRLLGKDYYTH